ncbi:hypothetical protein D3C72_1745910 [compost metagenome]
MVLTRLIRLQVHVVEPRRGVAIFVSHQLHQQHAVEKVVGPRHPHTGIGQPEQSRYLGVLPSVLGLLASVLRAFGHGSGLAAVAHFAPFLVLGSLAETALVGFLVDLGTA